MERHASEQAAIPHSVTVRYLKGCTTKGNGSELADHSELKFLKLHEGEVSNSDIGKLQFHNNNHVSTVAHRGGGGCSNPPKFRSFVKVNRIPSSVKNTSIKT
jgi:hypothetical protein